MRRLLAVSLPAVACAPEIRRDEAPQRVVALSDPAAETPLALDPATGLLRVPAAPNASPPSARLAIQAQKDAVDWVTR